MEALGSYLLGFSWPEETLNNTVDKGLWNSHISPFDFPTWLPVILVWQQLDVDLLLESSPFFSEKLF